MIVALDFETANASRASICSVGLAVCEHGLVTDRREYLVRPHPDCSRFDSINISIHGITPAMVESAPEWDEVWNIVCPMIEHRTVIAHNAAFDISALRSVLSLYGLAFPDFDYLCTYKLSARVWPELENHKLDTLASYIGHEFQHHNAEADAEAAALLLEKMMTDNDCGDPFELAGKFGIAPGHVFSGGDYTPCSAKKRFSLRSSRKKI